MVQKIGRGGHEGGEGKEEEEEEEEEEKEEDEEEDEEEEEEDKEDEEDEEDEQEEEDEKDEEEEEDEAKRKEEGRGGGSLSKISLEEILSKLRLKLNQNKAKSTKHAGRPADLRGFGWKEMSCEGLKEIWWGGWIGKDRFWSVRNLNWYGIG